MAGPHEEQRLNSSRETALKTSSSVINALAELGISREEMANLDVIEIGCGTYLHLAAA